MIFHLRPPLFVWQLYQAFDFLHAPCLYRGNSFTCRCIFIALKKDVYHAV